MSAFSLGQLAAVAGKHPRTMRRWFDLGFFGQAATRTSGGQRRVCGLSAAMLVASARKQAQGFERARFPKEEKAMRRIKRLARKINRQMANNVPRLDKQTCAVANLVGRLFFILAEVSDDQLEGYGLPPGPVHELAWLTEINEENARSVLVTSLALWMKKINSSQPKSLARAIGISRRTLGRRLSQYLPEAKARAQLASFLAEDGGYDHKGKKWQPINFPGRLAGWSDEDRNHEQRKWRSMLNYKMNATKPPNIDKGQGR